MRTSRLFAWAAALALAQCALMTGSQAAEPETDKPAAACRDTGRYVPPQVPWMGEFYYQVSLRAKGGRPDEVDVDVVRGMDRNSDRAVAESLKEHVRKNYSCEGEDKRHAFYLRLNFAHDAPALPPADAARLLASRQATDAARYAAGAASAAAAAASNDPSGTLVSLAPLRAEMVCTAMGRPDLPRVDAVGTLLIHVVAYVIDDKMAAIDPKLKIGSIDAKLNNMFIKAVSRAMRETYRCPGNHVFEQEFQFTIS